MVRVLRTSGGGGFTQTPDSTDAEAERWAEEFVSDLGPSPRTWVPVKTAAPPAATTVAASSGFADPAPSLRDRLLAMERDRPRDDTRKAQDLLTGHRRTLQEQVDRSRTRPVTTTSAAGAPGYADPAPRLGDLADRLR